MYSQSSEVTLAPHSRDKNKYGNQGRCDTWASPGKWQQVRGGIAWTSQICYLVWGMLVDSYDSTSDALFFLLSVFFSWKTELPEEASFDCRDFKKSSAAHLKGIRPDMQLLKKRDEVLDVNADHDQSAGPLAIGSLLRSLDIKSCDLKQHLLRFGPLGGRRAPRHTERLTCELASAFISSGHGQW